MVQNFKTYNKYHIWGDDKPLISHLPTISRCPPGYQASHSHKNLPIPKSSEPSHGMLDMTNENCSRMRCCSWQWRNGCDLIPVLDLV